MMFKNIINFFDYYKCNKNYSKKINELHLNKRRPIKICFLIRENQKWSYQSLYEAFEKSDEFEPLVLVSMLWLSHIGKDKTRNNLEENYNFFKNRGIKVEYAYKDGKYIDLKEFNPDIVFYDQPWDLPDIHKPTKVSEFALTCYVPYGLAILDFKEDYTKEFHKLLYKFLVTNKYDIERFEGYSKGNSKNCVYLGFSKFDEYLKNNKCDKWKDENKIKIIYAPHHSFDKKGLCFATFKENGNFILEYAKKHPETTWIFKPHPRFKYSLLRNKIMTQEEIIQYYSNWEQIGKVYEQGDYFDIFRTSDLLITDCCSFLGEYCPTDKPIIRLVGKQKCDFNKFGKMIINSCYEARDNSEIEKCLETLLKDRNDYKAVLRKGIIEELIDFNEMVSVKIIDYIKKCGGGNG